MKVLSKVSVRKYQATDREQCRDLWRELTEWHRQIYQDSHIGGEHPEDYFDKHLAKVGSEQLWVAEQNTKVVGLVGLMNGLYGDVEIEPLIVSRAYRGKGIGTQLVLAVVTEARKRGLRSLSVSPVARNINAIKFLYNLGFKNLGYIQLFIDFTDYRWKQGPEIFECKFKY
jgi:ribosomal protein S18 acetylase RimI-like enzyme